MYKLSLLYIGYHSLFSQRLVSFACSVFAQFKHASDTEADTITRNRTSNFVTTQIFIVKI